MRSFCRLIRLLAGEWFTDQQVLDEANYQACGLWSPPQRGCRVVQRPLRQGQAAGLIPFT